jgi:hypothetical protein
MTRADKYHVLLLKVFILTLASIAITARPTPATAQEDEGLCVIDRTGKRNGIWNTCYSVLGKPKPDEAILCDTGMFSGEGHCRVLPIELCELVIGKHDESCWVSADVDDPEAGYIGWRPLRTFAAQEPVLELVNFILGIQAIHGENTFRALEEIEELGEMTANEVETKAKRTTASESLTIMSRKHCNIAKVVTKDLRNVYGTGQWRRAIRGYEFKTGDPYENICNFALLCALSAQIIDPPVFDGLTESLLVINRLQCPADENAFIIATMENRAAASDFRERTIENSSYGPAYAAALKILYAGDDLNDAELLSAREDVHRYLFPNEMNIVSRLATDRLALATPRLKAPPDIYAFALEAKVFVTIARHRNTTLVKVAELLFPD